MQRPDLTKHLSLPFESRLDVIATSTGKTTVETVVPVCDRSGDIGSHHVWRDGATVGDRCLCGKRKRVARPAGD